jgi:hypothetical protein
MFTWAARCLVDGRRRHSGVLVGSRRGLPAFADRLDESIVVGTRVPHSPMRLLTVSSRKAPGLQSVRPVLGVS